MQICNWLILSICVFHFRHADSLVVTKYETETITSYLKHLSTFRSDEANEFFLNTNTNEYCLELRRSYMFQSVTLPNKQPKRRRDPSTMTHYVPQYLRELIKELPTEIRMRKFRVENLNRTLSFQSFQCRNHEGDPMWFITPAFIPDSAFLFEVEPRFRYLITRELYGTNEIPAKLIGIIDESVTGTEIPDFDDNLLYRSASEANFSSRDKLCDLNHILQYRLCVIVADELRKIESTLWLHRSLSSNYYYQPEEHDRSCKPVRVKRDNEHDTSDSFIREILHCLVHISGYNTTPFYLGLLENFSKIINLERTFINETKWNDLILVHHIPLLKHLDDYQKVLENIDT